MSSKKKVQFSDKKSYQKYKKQSDSGSEEQSDDDRNNISDDEATNPKKVKHSLDSDEEDNSDKYKSLNRDTLNDIGQEAKTAEFDDDIKLTPFNMKDELEEGDFDQDGYYHWKKDKDQVKDAWLDNIDWANINTFKKVDEKSANIYKLDGDEEEEETSDEDENEDDKLNLTGQDDTSQIETFKKMVIYMKPGESVLKAIKRLGNSSKGSQSVGTMSASQRWLKKKNQNDQAKNSKESESSAADKEALDKLTGFANHFIDRGFYDIYEETYEKLKYKIDEAENAEKNAAKSFDIFADDVDESELEKAGTSNKKSEVLQDAIIKWVYRLENTEDSKLFGPFTTQQMVEMSDKGEFKDSGVWCRKLDDSSNNAFYNSKRIDFDLYS